VPIDFVILAMAEDSHTQIILGRPFLAITGCKTDAKEGKVTFVVVEHHAEFGLFKDFGSPSSTISSCRCETLDSNERVSMIDMTPSDPSSFDCTLFEGSRLMALRWIFCHLALLRTSPMLLTRVI